MSNLTPDQEKGMKALLKLIEATHTLISNGLFPGVACQNVTEVLVWLSKYHKDVKNQLPVETPKAEAVASTPSVAVEPKVGA